MGIQDKPTSPASPWQNGFAERLIGSIRRECADHIIVLGEMHLRRVLKSYADYYNCVRRHRSLNKDAPVSRPVQRIGVISSHAFSADFTTTTPELKFRYTQGRRRSLRSRGHASGSHRSAAGQHDQLADHRRPVDPATELEHTRLVGGERDGGELAALDGETDIVAVDRGRVLRAVNA
jgi:hypothetical protein